jgi:hypothetical protein
MNSVEIARRDCTPGTSNIRWSRSGIRARLAVGSNFVQRHLPGLAFILARLIDNGRARLLEKKPWVQHCNSGATAPSCSTRSECLRQPLDNASSFFAAFTSEGLLTVNPSDEPGRYVLVLCRLFLAPRSKPRAPHLGQTLCSSGKIRTTPPLGRASFLAGASRRLG